MFLFCGLNIETLRWEETSLVCRLFVMPLFSCVDVCSETSNQDDHEWIMEIKWKEALEAHFKARIQDLLVETEGNHERRASEYLFSRSKLEIRKYRPQSRSAMFRKASTASDVIQAAEFCSSTWGRVIRKSLGSVKAEQFIRYTAFWDVTLCSLADGISVSEEPAASIFREEEMARMYSWYGMAPREDLKFTFSNCSSDAPKTPY